MPNITTELVLSGGQEEGASAHLEAQYTPVHDPDIKVNRETGSIEPTGINRSDLDQSI